MEPEYQFKIREIINYKLARGRGLGVDQDTTNILAYFNATTMPDLLNFADTTVPSFMQNTSTLISPRFAYKMIAQKKYASEGILQSLSKIDQVSKILNIYGYGRFDNARELIRNRYLIASPAEQEQLRAILEKDLLFGKKYFDGNLSEF